MEISIETLYSVANTWILPGWVLLWVAPGWKYTARLVFYVAILPLALTYAILLFADIGNLDLEAASTLEGLTKAFANPRAVLVGWIHYLAFDLMVGLVIARDGNRKGINKFLMAIPLFFTLMTGPFGLLLYAVVRFLHTRKLEAPGV